jgi:hypothetical protein
MKDKILNRQARQGRQEDQSKEGNKIRKTD